MKETKTWINEIREEIDEAKGLQIEGSESIVEPQFVTLGGGTIATILCCLMKLYLELCKLKEVKNHINNIKN